MLTYLEIDQAPSPMDASLAMRAETLSVSFTAVFPTWCLHFAYVIDHFLFYMKVI